MIKPNDDEAPGRPTVPGTSNAHSIQHTIVLKFPELQNYKNSSFFNNKKDYIQQNKTNKTRVYRKKQTNKKKNKQITTTTKNKHSLTSIGRSTRSDKCHV